MRLTGRQARFLLGMALCAATVLAFVWAVSRLHIDYDILNSLPSSDDVTRDAREIIRHNPALDRVIIDLSLPEGPADKDRLVQVSETISARLRGSGLFQSVGLGGFNRAMPELLTVVTDNLPLMFDTADLEQWETESLSPDKVTESVARARERLLGLEGIGQAAGIEKDPLELRFRVLGRMMRISFYREVQFYRDQLFSADGKHLLLVCEPAVHATDTSFSRKLTDLLAELAQALAAGTPPGQAPVEIVSLGSFRYALDNEEIVRRDATNAVILITVGIAVMLLVSFPRPWIGLLALVPAVAGSMLALFVYSLFRPSISALALGFGGGMISITVDHCIAYLLFLDRTEDTRASYASKTVWTVGLFAVLTTAGAFCVLLVSGFPLLAEVGLFAAWGMVLSFLFLHVVFPLLIPELKAARRPPLLPMEVLLARATTSRGWTLFSVSVLLALVAVFFAKPEFQADLRSMNTVTPETLEAETVVSEVWGNIAENVYVMLEGNDPKELQRLGDPLADRWEGELSSGVLRSGFAPSMVFPGPERGRRNFHAWQNFWTPDRIARLRAALQGAAAANGFSAGAFDSFLEQVESPQYRTLEIPEDLFDFFGISRKEDGTGWFLLASASPGEHYNAESFFQGMKQPGFRVFDPSYFSARLASILSHTFAWMLLLVAGGLVIVLLALFFSFRLVLLTLAPLLFSLVMTLGTLKLLNRPLDIPGLMLAVVIFGMGVDYGIYMVRSQQRFLSERHPSQGPIRTGVFLAAASTLLGMGALAFSRHAVLRSVGITSLLGIGYSVLGAFLLLPPVLARLFMPLPPFSGEPLEPGSKKHRRAVLSRFTFLEAYPRLFARIKIRTDPMFPRLAWLVPSSGTVLDIGCGYGVPAVWMLALHPTLTFVGLEPDPDRARVAGYVIGTHGRVKEGTAQHLPDEPCPVDAVLFLDVGHYLSDPDMDRLLEDLHRRLVTGGPLVMRITIRTDRSHPWKKFKEDVRIRWSRFPQFLRTPDQITEQLARHGFRVRMIEDEGRDVCWFVATPVPDAEGQAT